MWQAIPAKQDTEDDFCVTLGLGGTTIGSWCTMPTKRSYKKRHQFPCTPTSGTPSAVPEERPRETQDEGSVPDSSPCSGLCRPRRGSWAKSLRGTRDGLIWEEVLGCVCVCVCLSVCLSMCVSVSVWLPFVVFSCGSMSQSTSLQLNTTPLADSIPVLFGLCIISCVC